MRIIAAIAPVAIMVLSGCVMRHERVYGPDCPQTTVEYEVYEEECVEPYVDTWLPLSFRLKELIEPYADGFFSPEVNRYSDFLYYGDHPRNSFDNAPCYVRADFNGDYVDDHAFLVSAEDLYGDYWSLTTRMIVVLSTRVGPDVLFAEDLGTIEADYEFPIEEYWSICVLPEGTHTYVTTDGVNEVEETVVLENDAFLMTFLETGEQDLFYAEDGELYYMSWNPASLAKKRTTGGKADRVDVKWREKLQRKVPGR